MNKTLATKYLNALKKEKGKYVTIVTLSNSLGVYPDVISRDLAEFEPLLNFDPEYNLKELMSKIEEYLIELKENQNKPVKKRAPVVRLKGETYQEFIYQKMTLPGGLMDPSIELKDAELRALRRLINQELALRKEKKEKK